MSDPTEAPFFVRPDEAVALHARPRAGWVPATAVTPTIVLAVLAGVGVVASDRLGGPAWVPQAVGAAVSILLVALWVWAWRRWATAEYVVTNSRVYARVGRLRVRVRFTTHDRITDLDYDRGVLDRLFGVSRLTVRTAGGDVRFGGVGDAIAVKHVVEDARDAFIGDLLDDLRASPTAPEPAGPERAPAPPDRAEGFFVPARPGEATGAPVATGPPVRSESPRWEGPVPPYLKRGEVPSWFAKPRIVPAVSTVLNMLVLLVFALAGFGLGPLGFTAAVAIVVTLIVAATWVRVLQLKRTEYVVTDRRVYVRRGVVGESVKQLTYDKITDISYDRDVLGRILGYGSVTVNTAGSNQAPVRMVGLADPLEAKERIEAARARALGEEVEP